LSLAGLLPQANHSALIKRASESEDKQRRVFEPGTRLVDAALQ